MSKPITPYQSAVLNLPADLPGANDAQFGKTWLTL
jgi:hypothetical protein